MALRKAETPAARRARPSRWASRRTWRGSSRTASENSRDGITVTDGPFTESKELIAGT